MLLIDQDLAHEIVCDTGGELHLVRRHEHLDLVHRELGPPAHEAFGIAERGHPLRGVRYGLVVAHLNQPLLIFGRQQGYEGRGLQIATVGPLVLASAAPIPTVPVRHRGARVLRRSAARIGSGFQCRVVLGGRRIGVGAHDIGDGAIDGAVAPLAEAVLRPRVRQLARRIAARVAFIGPILSVEPIVLRRVEIYGQGSMPAGGEVSWPSTPHATTAARNRVQTGNALSVIGLVSPDESRVRRVSHKWAFW